MRRRRKRIKTEEEINNMKEEIRIICYLLFRAGEIIAIILLCKYIYDTNKPPTTLHPNDSDLPIVIEQVKTESRSSQ